MIIKTRLKRNKHLYKSFYFFVQNSNKCREKYPETGKHPLKTNIIYVFLPFTAFTTYYI